MTFLPTVPSAETPWRLSWGPVIWQGGPAFLYLPLRSLQDLAAAQAVQPHWAQLMRAANVDSAYLYLPDGAGYRARMFSPDAGIPEDPATGSASAILAAQLLISGALAEGETQLPLRQGIEMGRPSQIRLTAVVEQGRLTQARVAGRAVHIASGQIRIPEDR